MQILNFWINAFVKQNITSWGNLRHLFHRVYEFFTSLQSFEVLFSSFEFREIQDKII